MRNAGFKALARRLSVGHAFSTPVKWNCEVEVFGTKITPGQLIHADKHGFLAIPEEDEHRLLEASKFMDSNECQTVIAAARNIQGKSTKQILEQISAASKQFKQNAKERFGSIGEW
jgi:regulator of RNase E activity RraA